MPTDQEEADFLEELEALGEVRVRLNLPREIWARGGWKRRVTEAWLEQKRLDREAFDVAAAIKEATELENPWARIGAVAGVGVFILAALAFAFRMGWF